MRWVSACAQRITTEALDPLENLVAPNLCEVCGGVAPGKAPLCPACRRTLVPCGFNGSLSGPLPRITAYQYTGAVARTLVHRFKYQGAVRLVDFLAAAIVRRWDWSRLPDRRIVLVPVPLTNGRYRERGYNQSRLLAEALATTLQLPMMELLRRARPTRSQTRLSEREREANIRRAFSARGATPFRQLVIVDDVWTTGATVRGCRDALAAAGHRVAACATAFWTPPRGQVEGDLAP